MRSIAASVIMLIFISGRLAFADQIACNRISEQASKTEIVFSPVTGYKVVGSGRLFFHTAPDKNCLDRQVFVIPGDQLIAYSEYDGWFSVMYINPKNGQDYHGWVQSKRLQFTGTMGSTD